MKHVLPPIFPEKKITPKNIEVIFGADKGSRTLLFSLGS